MSDSDTGEITLLLSNISDPKTLDTLIRLAYDELHRMAIGHFRKERPGHTWGATVLVNEACIRLIQNVAPFKNRKHFFGAASRAMRQLLVESARRRNAQRRGARWRRVDLDHAERMGFDQPQELLDLDVALNRLTTDQPQLAVVVELRIFGGCSHAEIATILGIAESTVRKRWAAARDRLRRELASRARA